MAAFEPRDPDLTWVTVTHDTLGEWDVGVIYDAAIPARPTSVYTYLATGNPGDPGEDAMCEVMDVREDTERDLSIVHLLSEAALDELASLVVNTLEVQAQREWKEAA